MIARAQYLMVFNGSEVRLKERKDAEQLYLKRILYELEATCGLEANIHPTNSDVESEKNRILSLHPRYEQLALQYPEIVDALIRRGIHTSNNDTTGGGPCALSSTLVRVQFIPMSMKASCFEPLEKKIPEKIRIAQLKLLVKNKFSIEPHEQLLSFRSNPKVSTLFKAIIYNCSY
jgi:hypothetical protein